MIQPQFILPLATKLIVDLFAGGGGASTGIEQALGRHVDIAINHDAEAVALHQANHPQTRHFVSDVFEVDPEAVCDGRPVGLLWASPDCFPAGTLVMTRDGYRAIEEIAVGDEVLTHRLRWRKVMETSNAIRPLMTIRGHGHYGLSVSPEHPFLARHRTDAWDNARRGYARTLDPQDWVPASILGKDWYWATPREFPAAVAPHVGGRGIAIDEKLMWLAGRYLGDGWTRLTDTRAELVITCGKHEIEQLRPLLDRWPRQGDRSVADELTWHERATGTAYQFTTNHRGLVEWLREHFGHRAEAKGVPAWALGIDPALRQALLDGYISADGSITEDFVEAGTVSKALAFGMKALANSLGKTVTVYFAATGGTATIEGRTVSTRHSYRIRFRHQVDANHEQTEVDVGLEWCPIREASEPGELARVFNIGVADDESYVVEGIVVHNCKHFSKAKGGKPVSKKIRGLAWVIVKWAKLVRPDKIIVENVEEFQTWGPLLAGGRVCPERKGRTFRTWKRAFERMGATVEHRELRACDYDTPTIRKRLFVVISFDGNAVVWPEPTNGPGLKSYRTAAECIDWSIPCPSIFERDRPLVEATLRRIAHGLKRFVIESASPFIVPVTHTQSSSVHSINEPLRTITTAKRGEFAIAAPTLIQTGYGERPGQAPRAPGLHKPLGTVVDGQKHALVAAFLAKHFGDRGQRPGSALDEPVATVTSVDHHSFVAAHLVGAGGPAYSGKPKAANEPVGTLTTENHRALVTSHLAKLRGTSNSAATDAPLATVSAGGTHHAEVRALLIKYYGTTGTPDLDEPMHTVTTRDRFALVTILGELYEIVDIGMRMLQPRELYRAQGFPDSYVIDRGADGRALSKAAQVRMVGNSVCPPLARALVAANFSDIEERLAA